MLQHAKCQGDFQQLRRIPAFADPRVIALERDKANLQAEVSRLRELSDEMFATIVAALSLAPQDCGAYGVLDEAIKSLQPKVIRSAEVAL